MGNRTEELLYSLGICSVGSLLPFYPRVRDREDISVLKCRKSGVIVLSSSDHMQPDHYKNQDGFEYWGAPDRKLALQVTAGDDQRRSQQFKNIIKGKVWLDIGTGLGGILDLLSPVALKTLSVEPQAGPRGYLIKLGYQVYPDILNIKETNIEVVTLFHVLEHSVEPIKLLQAVKSRMIEGGRIIIEVPHAKDFLLFSLRHKAFRAFTFWSEHLILHTEQSLRAFLVEAGFKNIKVNGFQRYPLVNHLYWLVKGKPGGHLVWGCLRNQNLDQAYEYFLKLIGCTDTLIVTAEV